MEILRWLGLLIPRALAVPGSGSSTVPTADGGITIQNPLACQEAVQCVQQLLVGLTVIAAPIAAVMILVGGFQLMFGAASEEKIKQGKKTIIYAAVGYAIILLSTAVVAVIQDFLTRAASGP